MYLSLIPPTHTHPHHRPDTRVWRSLPSHPHSSPSSVADRYILIYLSPVTKSSLKKSREYIIISHDIAANHMTPDYSEYMEAITKKLEKTWKTFNLKDPFNLK